MALQDLSGELRQERQGSQELTQQFAKAKASWEVERNGLKSLIAQVKLEIGRKKNNFFLFVGIKHFINLITIIFFKTITSTAN